MSEIIQSGTILIKEFTPVPGAFPLMSEAYVPGWQVVKNLDAYALDRRFREAGWNFFYRANEINVIVLGLDGPKRIRKAVERIMAKLDVRRFNALEITSVTSKHFFGAPCVSVSAHPRHIQESIRIFHATAVQNSNEINCHSEAVSTFTVTLHPVEEEPSKRLSREQ